LSIKVNISKLQGNEDFVPLQNEQKKICSSYISSDDPIGNLRWKSVSNGRYERHHPVYDKNDSIVGYLTDGVANIGYTYCCLYSDRANCFFVSHVPFGMVWGNNSGESSSFISVVSATGRFKFFKQGLKYSKGSSFRFPSSWVGSELIYRFIDDGESLLCVSKLGFCVIRVYGPTLATKTLFGNEYEHQLTGAKLSPNTNILAITLCDWQYTDPIKGEEVYRNTLQIFDIKSGIKLASQDLNIATSINECQIRFNEAGDALNVKSTYTDFNEVFKLAVTSI